MVRGAARPRRDLRLTRSLGPRARHYEALPPDATFTLRRYLPHTSDRGQTGCPMGHVKFPIACARGIAWPGPQVQAIDWARPADATRARAIGCQRGRLPR